MQNNKNIQTQTYMPPASDEVRDKLQYILEDTEAAERFYNAFYEQFFSDEEPPEKKGRFMAEAILANSVEDFLVAVIGWSSESLLRFAEV